MLLHQFLSVFDKMVNKFILFRKMRNTGSLCGKDLTINGMINMHGDGAFVFGNQVRINSSERSNPIGGMTRTILCSYAPGKLEIGDHVGISNSAIVCKVSVVIEPYVKIGGNVKIYDTDFHAMDAVVRVSADDTQCAVSAPVRIKQGAFIGAHSVILKGVTIGEGAIVGAGSVVTKDIGDYEVWAGNPAKLIKKAI